MKGKTQILSCLESSKSWAGIGSIAWSSAGDRVAVVALGPKVTGLWVLDADTMGAVEAVHWKGEGFPNDLVWSSDATRIAFTVGDGQASDIWKGEVVEPVDGEPLFA